MSEFWNALPAVALPALMFYFCFWIPFRRVRSAKSWMKTPCVIVSSSVDEDTGDSGLYRIGVTYEYGFRGHQYRASRYNFSIGATAGTLGKKRIVRRLPPGTKTVCYVNPQDPGDAVIDRGLTWDAVFMGGFAIVCFGAFLFFFFTGLASGATMAPLQ